jgi:hypothetical protein
MGAYNIKPAPPWYISIELFTEFSPLQLQIEIS